jgi:L-lactate dehydrogenase (cytochrome)
MYQFAIKLAWGINYVTHEASNCRSWTSTSIRAAAGVDASHRKARPSMNWNDVAEMVRLWNDNSA